MEKIEERAELCQQYQEIYGGNFATAYTMGAREQHKIDIEKAVRWLDDNINNYLFNDNSNGKYRDWLKCSSQAFIDFRKAMEL